MSIHTTFLSTAAARTSLKRGLARQAFTHAGVEADLPRMFRNIQSLCPNPKAMERVARRIAGCSGIAQVRLRPDRKGLKVLARNLRDVTTMASATPVFEERAIVYTFVNAYWDAGRLASDVARVSFCLHAVERLVERSGIALDRPLLPLLDAEAAALFRHLRADRTIERDGDMFVEGGQDGLWAGSLDRMAMEGDWPVKTPDGDTPVFSARTFLGPEQINPMIWLLWRGQGMADPKSPRR